MADAFKELPHASFDSHAFPVKKVHVGCQLRHHLHEYPKVPTGSIEKLGRKPYTIKMTAVFDKNLLAPWNTDNLLWPNELSDLFDAFDQGVTSDLMIPTVGTIKAVCIDWNKEMEVKSMRSGEMAELTFLEDQSSEFLIESLIQARAGNLVSQAQALSAAAAAAGQQSLFEELLGMMARIGNLVNTGQLYASVLQTQVEIAVATCEHMDSFGLFDDANNAAVLEAQQQAWEALLRFRLDLLHLLAIPLIDWITPSQMSVQEVAISVYGDTNRAVEVLQLNALPDAFAIPARTKLRIYAPDVNQRAA